MDHLPEIKNPAFEMPRILYICQDVPYDRLGFITFPQRMGWQVIDHYGNQRLANPKDPHSKSHKTVHEEAAFLQAWLFFGVLVEVFNVMGLSVDEEEFIDRPSGEESDAWLTTEELGAYLLAWQMLEKDASQSERDSHAKAVYEILSLAGAVAEDDFGMGLPGTGYPGKSEGRDVCPLSHEETLPILVLLESLWNTANRIWTEHEDTPSFSPGPSPIPRRQMEAAGWCPSTINRLIEGTVGTRENIPAYFASMLPRPVMAGNHEMCSEVTCTSHQINEDEYETKHVEDDCHCSFLHVDSLQMATLIRRGKIPRIRLHVPEGSNDPLDINLTVVEEGAYVALSHVWSHGLGNPQSNALPRCQLRRLNAMVQELVDEPEGGETVAIWLDTICIPTQHEYKDARRLSIIRLGETFSKSDSVLVLDRELLHTSNLASELELCLRILICDWQTRLWTLQETFLGGRDACKIYWQLQDDPVSFPNLVYGEDGSLPLPDLSDEVIRRVVSSEYWDEVVAENENKGSLLLLMQSVVYRTISKPEDEAVCLASILGLDIQQIVAQSSPGNRMKILMALAKEIPADFIFCVGARMEEPGCRWMLKSFLGIDPRILMRDSPLSTFNDRGIHVTLPGVFLKIKRQIADNFTFQNPFNQKWYSAIEAYDAESSRKFLPPSQQWRNIAPKLHLQPRPAFVFHEDCVHQNDDWLRAVVVFVEGEEDGVLYARYGTTVQLNTTWEDGENDPSLSNLFADLWHGNWKGLQDEPAIRTHAPPGRARVSVTRIDQRQRWCLG